MELKQQSQFPSPIKKRIPPELLFDIFKTINTYLYGPSPPIDLIVNNEANNDTKIIKQRQWWSKYATNIMTSSSIIYFVVGKAFRNCKNLFPLQMASSSNTCENCKNLEIKLLELQKEITDLKKIHSDEMEQMKEKMARSEKKIVELEAENGQMKKKIVELEAENGQMKKKIVELEAENGQMKKKIVELEAENGQMKKKIVELEAENGQMKNKVVELEAENGQMKNKVVELEQEIMQLKCNICFTYVKEGKGLSFGATSPICKNCREFFSNSTSSGRHESFSCKLTNECVKGAVLKCGACRYKRCLELEMKPSLITKSLSPLRPPIKRTFGAGTSKKDDEE